MTKSAQEILAEWADPETGGTMPKEVREAALSVLTEIERLWEALDDIATGYWCRKYGASVTAREFARAALQGGGK